MLEGHSNIAWDPTTALLHHMHFQDFFVRFPDSAQYCFVAKNLMSLQAHKVFIWIVRG